MRRRVFGLCVMAAVVCPAFADDKSQQPYWSGRLADKPKFEVAAEPKAGTDAKPAADAKQGSTRNASLTGSAPREPEWLRRMDKNERSTLTGGWKLQNWSGGTQSQTSAGDRQGQQYAPNTYQGSQFQQWNNVSTRQDVPSWNGAAPSFPRQMWSQGYVSPNNYYGADAQLWGNMSSGTMMPNPVSGGWTMSPWR